MSTSPWAAIGRFPRVLFAIVLSLAAVGSFAAPGARPAAAQTTIDCSQFAAPAPAATPGTATPATASAATPAAVVPFPAAGGDLTVFAAASLTNAFDEIGGTLEADNPGLDITFNYAGSQALVTQLTEGAKADVFASANNSQMTKARDAGVIAGVPERFVTNRLALVVPADNPAGITSLADLANDGVSVVLAQPDVPVGQYARQSLCAAGQDSATYGDGFVDAVAGNVVSEEEDVRDVLTRIQLGEANAGIVYVSDYVATEGGGVALVEIPDDVNAIASYPIAAVEGGDADLAAAFISYVLGPDGQAVLQDYGFEPAA
jgi:molybdate transport system substrate-binding protein